MAVAERGTGGGWLAGWEMSERKQHGWEGEKKEREKERKKVILYFIHWCLYCV